MIDRNFLEILACPETQQPLTPAAPALVAEVNARIEAGTLRDRAARPVAERVHELLVRADGKYGYPVRDAVPTLDMDSAISLVPRAEQW